VDGGEEQVCAVGAEPALDPLAQAGHVIGEGRQGGHDVGQAAHSQHGPGHREAETRKGDGGPGGARRQHRIVTRQVHRSAAAGVRIGGALGPVDGAQQRGQ
jgi:hypothetical protein